MVELMKKNWDPIMEGFGNEYASEDDKLELVCHLNSKVDELGEFLFGSERDPEAFSTFVKNLDKPK